MIYYIKDMKYALSEDYCIQTPVTGYSIIDPFFELREDGFLTIRRGFVWDGASGPTIDTDSAISASAVHDVFCICMRDRRISYTEWQDEINRFFKDMCIRNGMPNWRAAIWHAAVEFGDAGNPEQGPDRKVHTAP